MPEGITRREFLDYLSAGAMLSSWFDSHEQDGVERVQLEFPSPTDAAEFAARKALLSQRLFIFSAHKDTLLDSGVGTGKTVALITKSLLASWHSPNNYGLIARDTEQNLITTTRKDFEDIAGKLIVEQNRGEGWMKVLARGVKVDGDPKTSQIAFRYLRSSSPGRKHLSNLNLGWYQVDQLEDIEEGEWDYLNTRLRRAGVRRWRGGIANPKGKDWLYRRYFAPAEKGKYIRKTMVPGKLGEDVVVEEFFAKGWKGDLYAIRSPTEENLYLPDGFVEDILANQSKEYIDRYLHGSFDDWGGKIYSAYHHSSVHNIESFDIPPHWPTLVSIDVGGDAPWAIIVARMDPHYGDVFVTNELYSPGLLVDAVVDWIKDPDNGAWPTPADRGQGRRDPRVIIDPENKPVVLEFYRHGLVVDAARKGPKVPKILHVAGYFRRKPNRVRMIPQHTAPGGMAIIENAPHLWVFKDCENWRREHDGYQWHRDARTDSPTNKPVDKDDHTTDAQLYMMILLPPVQQLPKTNPDLERLRQVDRLSYREAKARMQAKERLGKERVEDRIPMEAWTDEEPDWSQLKKELSEEPL